MSESALEFMKRLSVERGAIVSSADCSEMEIAFARSENRFYVDGDSLGYVLRPEKCRKLAETALHSTSTKE